MVVILYLIGDLWAFSQCLILFFMILLLQLTKIMLLTPSKGYYTTDASHQSPTITTATNSFDLYQGDSINPSLSIDKTSIMAHPLAPDYLIQKVLIPETTIILIFEDLQVDINNPV
ncbi:hypothetical protein VP01_5775g1, partial [Puccinia sorghi]